MKKLIFISIITIAMAACSNQEAQDGQLAQLRAEKDSLKTVHEEIGARIAELDEQIALLDTTKKLTLVTTQSIIPSTFNHYFEVQGSIESEKNTMVYPEASGTIRAIKVREGQKVNQGDLLMQLDDDVIRKSIVEAQSAYNLAKTVYEKQSALWDQKIGSEMQFLEAKTNKEASEARLASLNAQLDLLSVRAPFTGTVDEIFPKIGELAAPQMPLLRIVNLQDVYIKADISERYLGDIQQGTKVMVSVPSFDEEIPSQISLVGNYINPNNRTFKVQVDIKSEDGMLKPNLLTTLRIQDFHADSAIVLPEAMVQQTPSGEDFVYIADKENEEVYVRKKIVSTGLSYKDQVMITEGLESGDLVIEKGARSVKDGQRVEIISQKLAEQPQSN